MVRPEIQAEIDATAASLAALRAALTRAFTPRTPLVAGPSGATAGLRLKAFRKDHKLSQRALGAAIGYAQGYITNIETGRSEPSREFARKLTEVYGVSADWLLFGRGAA